MAQAIPFVQLGFSVIQAKNQNAAGKYNQQVYNRNAQIAEQEAQQIEKQTEVDLQRFDQKFNQLQGQTTTRIAKTGADFSGTGLRVLRANAEEAEKERNIMEYNAKIGQARKFEEANFSRIQGQVARQTARTAQIGTIVQTGTSLLRMGGYSGGSKQQPVME